MNELLDRIQNWYKLNCNGDWEHSFGYSIATLDNPGWTIRIDLNETPLEKLVFTKNYQNPEKEHDWFIIETKDQTLSIACGPENLKEIFIIFFDEIIPNFADKDFKFEIYLPLKGYHLDLWTPAIAKFNSESSVEIIEIPKIEYSEVKFKNLDEIDFDQNILDNLKVEYKIGHIVEIDLEDVFDGVIRTPKKK